jgi:hypothetical protein
VDKPKPASAFLLGIPFGILLGRRVSRFGVNPKPTVKVRMKENGSRRLHGSMRLVVPYALILVLKEESHESDVARRSGSYF